ncbi:transcriptional regulator GcvA [Neptuniibacter halophilus]|uniref:transcriptional regulator GcvA n=1 Tax=Neptuniibacter halophilus TaxID=651666 RepID=UPI0025741D7E|nr:transcriptional regulator GcvA [Neptuniibacter halophilus]
MTIRRLPPLNALRSFEAAARLRSFNKAADELFVTPSAVSHQIKGLEEFLGVQLFERIKRRVELTAPGERYLISVQTALDEIDDATRRLMTTPNSGVVNLSVAPAFLTRWLVPRINHFQNHNPEVELRLTASMSQIDFRYSDMDMAVFFGDGNWPDLHTHHLRNVHSVPVCSPKLLEGKPDIKTAEDLLKYTLIHVSKRDTEWKSLLRQEGVSRIDTARNMTFSNTSLALGAAMEGLGIALADRGLAVRELEYGQLICPLDITLNTQKAFYLVYQKSRPLTESMQAFRDWILDEMQTEQRNLKGDDSEA